MTANIGHYWRVASLPFDGVSLLYSLRWDAPAAGYVPGPGKDALVNTERILIMLDPCVHRWKLYGCAVFGGGRLGIEWEKPARAGGGGLQIHNPPIFVTGGRLGIDVPFLSRFGVRVSGELLATLNPATFPIDERTRWTIPRVSGSLELGLYYSLDPR